MRFFPNNENGSRVVLTTRLSNVAKDCVSSPFEMKLLDEAKSWELFCEKAFQNELCPLELREVGEEIVKLCKGLALSIVLMGGILLNSPRTVECWNGVVRDLKSFSNSKEKQESLDVLSLSYTHLPPHLKPCFLYMGMFQEDYEIRVSNVVKLWVAEGFIKPIETGVLEEIAEGYLKDMIDRNTISVVRQRKNGKIKCCGIHNLLRDLCLKVSEQQQFFHEISRNTNLIQGTERRIVSASNSNSAMMLLPLTRSIITYNSRYKPDKCRLLRVCSQGRCDSADELYGRVNLRYLAYKYPYYLPKTWELPTSVSLIWNLQTLIIKEASGDYLVVAPIQMWKMRQLRHVKCHSIYLPWSNGQDEMLILDNLQTLKEAMNFKLSEEVYKIIPNITQLHLRYDLDFDGYDDCLIEHLCNLGQLHKLEALHLSIKSSSWPRPYTGLKKILRFPSSLKKLSMKYCRLEWEDLSVIGSLPHPEVLLLECWAVWGNEWSPVNGEFCHLKFLRINGMHNNLKYWNAENSNFPVLEKLVLVECLWLKEIPLDIGEIPTLQLIRVEYCSKLVADSAVKIKDEQLENMGDDCTLEVQLIMMKNEDVVSSEEDVACSEEDVACSEEKKQKKVL